METDARKRTLGIGINNIHCEAVVALVADGLNSHGGNAILFTVQIAAGGHGGVCRENALSFPGRAGGGVPGHSLAGAVGEVDHVSGCGGVVTDFGRFIAWPARANGIEEVGKVKHGGVGLVVKGDVLRRGLHTGSL